MTPQEKHVTIDEKSVVRDLLKNGQMARSIDDAFVAQFSAEDVRPGTLHITSTNPTQWSCDPFMNIGSPQDESLLKRHADHL
jgi:hypothetical protein